MEKSKAHSKIKTLSEIAQVAAALRRRGKKIVTVSGSFDLMHAGHLRFLDIAKRQGDKLIVLVNSDWSTRTYKGPHRPIIPCRSRMEMLAALAVVDYVVSFNELIPNESIAKIKPHVHCNGADWGRGCVERKSVEDYEGRLHIIPLSRNISTSAVVKKVATAYKNATHKAVFLDRDGVINHNGKGYLHKIGDFTFLPGALAAIARLARSSYKIIIVSNQSGVGRGLFTERDLAKLHRWMISVIRSNSGRIDGIYYCPHRPGHKCKCRKPETGLILQASKDFNLSLSESWFVGDSFSDIVAGRRTNVKTIKIGEKMPKALKLEPHYYSKDLVESVEVITNQPTRSRG